MVSFKRFLLESKDLNASYVDVIIPPSSPKEQYELIVKYIGKAFADSLPPEHLAHESIHAIQIRDDLLNPNKIKEEIDLEGVDFDDFEADRERKRVYFSRPPEIMAFAHDVATQAPAPPGVPGTVGWQEAIKEYQYIGGDVYDLFLKYVKDYNKAIK